MNLNYNKEHYEGKILHKNFSIFFSLNVLGKKDDILVIGLVDNTYYINNICILYTAPFKGALFQEYLYIEPI